MLEYSGFLQIRHPKSAIRNKKDPLLLCSPNPPPDSYRDGGEGEGDRNPALRDKLRGDSALAEACPTPAGLQSPISPVTSGA